MKILEDSIKTFNLIFTDTLKSEDFCQVRFDLEDEDVNYDNCISLYDLIYAFNKMHRAFKKEYDALDKVNVGKEIEANWFSRYYDGEDYCRVLELLVEDPKIKNYKFDEVLLFLREINDKCMSDVLNNGRRYGDSDYYRDGIELDSNKVKKYLDLFEKYEILFDLYRRLKDTFIYGDGTYTIFFEMDNYHAKFLNDIKKIKLSLGASYFLSEGDDIRIIILLGDELSIDLEHSYINIKGENIPINSELCFDILKRVYINGKILEKFVDKQKGKNGQEKVKMLKDNI